MATMQTDRRAGALSTAGRTIFHHLADQLGAAMARRRVYRRTVFELRSLSDRELRDLGIARADIRRLAIEAADGHQ